MPFVNLYHGLRRGLYYGRRVAALGICPQLGITDRISIESSVQSVRFQLNYSEFQFSPRFSISDNTFDWR
jgi:hypothetical protein